MKRVALLLFCCAAFALAQQQPPPPAAPMPRTNVAERVEAPTYSDLYCSGFLTKQEVSRANYIVAGMNAPNQTQFAQRDTVFLEGSGYQEGARYSVVRELTDPNRQPLFSGQRALIAETGQPYAELGRVRVTALRGKTAIAEVEFSCTAIVQGDLVVPFQEKAPVSYRPTVAFERFPAGASNVTARVVMAKDFDNIVATGQKVYINAGADKGVKVGDYFRVVASYDPAKMNYVDALSYKTTHSEDTQKNKQTVMAGTYAELPKRAVAEMIVLTVTPTSSTAMITRALESVNVGDTVQLEGTAAPEQ